MADPVLTIYYLAPLALIFSVLSLIVVAQRARTNTPFGDGGHESLLRAIRAHGNFAEWVPIAVLLIGSVEMLGVSSVIVHSMLGVLLAARILHPFGLFSEVDSAPYLIGRIAGALATWGVVTGATVILMLELA